MVFNKKAAWFILVVLGGVTFSMAEAASAGASNRSEHRLGVTANLFEPYPGLLGLSVSYNYLDYARALVGYGFANSGDASISTASLGTRLLVPKWNLSPFLGFMFGFASYQGTGSVLHVTSALQHFYSDVGVDWQMDSGMNMGLCYKFTWTAGIPGTMSLYFGWYFSL